MKRVIFIVTILLSVSVLHAQKDTTFYRHEVKVSVAPTIISSLLWFQDVQYGKVNMYYCNFSISYFYRPVKWFWVGGNFVNYFGSRTFYDWREYYPDGNYRDFEKSKRKFCSVFAPEIRFSYLNKKSIILYSALSVGVGYEDGYDNQWVTFPRIFTYAHLTCIGMSYNFGEKNNGFLGGEFGVGHKGFFIFHGGYRF